MSDASLPKFTIRFEDKTWYEFFRNDINRLLDQAKSINNWIGDK